MNSAVSAVAAVGKENVVIDAGDCSMTILPRFGGKIASLKVRGHELLEQPLAPIAPRTETMPFDAGDASGWDECLPSVAACSVSYAGDEARIPDHGDLWRVEWKQEPGNGFVAMAANCFSLPLKLERGVALRETANGWRIDLDYKLTNMGTADAPWAWAAHPLFTSEAGDRVVLPERITELKLEGSRGRRLGTKGDTVGWPKALLTNGDTVDLSVAQAPDAGIGDKLFAGPLSADENWYVLERPSAGVRIRMSFDAGVTPYLGMWLCYGGWPERPGPKQVCMALEPTTAPMDSLAEAGSAARWLKPGESCVWKMAVELETF